MAAEKPEDIVSIDKWDSGAVKNCLDDTIRNVILDKLNFIEDHKLIDRRLCICTLSLAVAIFALVYDYLHPYPQSRAVLIFSVIAYFVLMIVLTIYVNYVEKGVFITAIERDPTGYDEDVVWTASSNLKKYDDMYSLILTSKPVSASAKLQATLKKSVANFFDEDGKLLDKVVRDAVIKLQKSLTLTEKND